MLTQKWQRSIQEVCKKCMINVAFTLVKVTFFTKGNTNNRPTDTPTIRLIKLLMAAKVKYIFNSFVSWGKQIASKILVTQNFYLVILYKSPKATHTISSFIHWSYSLRGKWTWGSNPVWVNLQIYIYFLILYIFFFIT